MRRRRFIQSIASFTTTVLTSFFYAERAGATWLAERFAPDGFTSRFERLYAGLPIVDSTEIVINLPDIAEDGAVVPITTSSELEHIESLAIWVEKNPTPLAAEFEFSEVVPVYLTARIKMAESCNVVVVARQGERLLRNRQWVKVMQGGCGTG